MPNPNEIGSDAWTIAKLRSFNLRLLAQVKELQREIIGLRRSLVDVMKETERAER